VEGLSEPAAVLNNEGVIEVKCGPNVSDGRWGGAGTSGQGYGRVTRYQRQQEEDGK
jgi:hypothetical protein